MNTRALACAIVISSQLAASLARAEDLSINGATGDATSSVAIESPSWYGLEPNLRLDYSTAGGGSSVAVGWTLVGTSFIDRRNGQGGPPALDGGDVYFLDGQELSTACATRAPWSTVGATHCTKRLSYQRIVKNSDDTWTVTQRTGVQFLYTPIVTATGGIVTRYAVTTVRDLYGRTSTYRYTVDSGFAYLAEVIYGASGQYRVELFYDTSRDDARTVATGNGLATLGRRLKTIAVRSGSALERAYGLSYSYSHNSHRSLLTAVQQFGRSATVDGAGTITGGSGSDAKRMPRTFTYRDGSAATTAAWTNRVWSPSPPSTLFSNLAGKRVLSGDFNGDGATDLMHVDSTGASVVYRLYLANPSGTLCPEVSPAPMFCAVERAEPNARSLRPAKWLAADVTGDGKTDLVEILHAVSADTVFPVEDQAELPRGCVVTEPRTCAGAQVYVWSYDVATASIDAAALYTATNDTQIDTGLWEVGDQNGDGRSDLIHIFPQGATGSVFAWLSQAGVGDPFLVVQTPSPSRTPCMACKVGTVSTDPSAYWSAGDFNGDGRTDLVYTLPTDAAGRVVADSALNFYIHVWLANGDGTFRVRSIQRTGTQDSAWRATLTAAKYMDKVRVGDFNGDGVSDLLILPNDTANAHPRFWFGLGNGDFSVGNHVEGTTFDFTFATPAEVEIADVNGDGKSDIIDFTFSAVNPAYAAQLFLSDSPGADDAHTVSSWRFNSRPIASITTGGYRRVGDFNGDGRSDLLQVEETVTVNAYVCGTNPPLGCSPTPCSGGIYNCKSYCFPQGVSIPFSMVDCFFNGYSTECERFGSDNFVPIPRDACDAFGLPFYVWGTAPQTATVTLWGDLSTAAATTSSGNELYTLTNERGGVSTLAYRPSSAWPDAALPAGMVVPTVSAVTLGDGRGGGFTRTFQYTGARWSHAERMFVFRAVSETIDSSGNRVETFFRQPAAGDTGACAPAGLDQVYMRDGAGNIYSATKYGYAESLATAPCSSHLTSQWSYQCERSTANASEIDQPGKCRRTLLELGYDAYGNTTRIAELGDTALSNDNRLTQIGYSYNSSAYLVAHESSRLLSVATASGTPAAGGTLRYQFLYYDGATVPTPPTRGRVTSTKEWESSTGGYVTTTATYDPATGDLLTETDPDGYTTTYRYNPDGRVVEVRDPAGHAATMGYTGFGERATATDTNAQTTRWTYDALGRITRTTAPDGSYAQVDYLDDTPPGFSVTSQRVRTTTSDAGATTSLWSEEYFDGLGRVYEQRRRAVSATGYDTRKSTYRDATTMVRESTEWYEHSADAAMTGYVYDGLGRLLRIERPDGSRVQRSYGWSGNTFKIGCATVIDEANHAGAACTDAYDRLNVVVDMDGAQRSPTIYRFNLANRLVSVLDPLGHETTTNWNSLGWSLREADPDRGARSHQYSPGGRLLRSVDAKGQQLAFAYDGHGRLRQKSYPDGTMSQWLHDGFDAAGSPEAGHGHATDRLTRVIYPAGSESYAYDGMGRITSETRKVKLLSQTFTYGYDALGRRSAVTFPDGESLQYRYDAAGRLSEIPGYLTSASYDSRGAATALNYANGTGARYTYDSPRHRLRDVTVAASAGPTLYQAGYTYGSDGLISRIVSSTNPAFDWNPTYDELHRLRGVTPSVAGAGLTESYRYDAIGRMFSSSAVGSYAYTDTRHRHGVTQAGNKGYTYDAVGNMTGALCDLVTTQQCTSVCPPPSPKSSSLLRRLGTLIEAEALAARDPRCKTTCVPVTSTGRTCARTLAWDADDRLVSETVGGVTTTMDYDAGEERIRKGDTYYFGPLLEASSAGALTKYIYAGSVLVAKRDGAGKHFFTTDHLGSVRLITGETGSVEGRFDYAPFGRALATNTSSLSFGGQRNDEADLGLIYMRARYYDPRIGRFASADSIIPSPTNSQAYDRYAYVYNNPVMNTDPSGHVPLGWIDPIVAAREASIAYHAAITDAYAQSWYQGQLGTARFITDAMQSLGSTPGGVRVSTVRLWEDADGSTYSPQVAFSASIRAAQTKMRAEAAAKERAKQRTSRPESALNRLSDSATSRRPDLLTEMVNEQRARTGHVEMGPVAFGIVLPGITVSATDGASNDSTASTESAMPPAAEAAAAAVDTHPDVSGLSSERAPLDDYGSDASIREEAEKLMCGLLGKPFKGHVRDGVINWVGNAIGMSQLASNLNFGLKLYSNVKYLYSYSKLLVEYAHGPPGPYSNNRTAGIEAAFGQGPNSYPRRR